MSTLLPDQLRFRCGITSALAATAVIVSPTVAWCAPGVVLDGSFGASGALPGPNYVITAGMGRQVGPNLFHSFNSFNLTSAESATFTGPANVQNILARVTGGPSSIDGTINSNIAGANLFLLNPAGVMFGPNAHVNVTGSFAVGTPDYIKMADGGRFNTSLGGTDNLTSAPVTAFGFLAAHPAPVQMNGSFLTVGTGQGLHVVAGNVSINFTELDAPSGKLSVFSAASSGEVPFSIATGGSGYANATNTSFGNVSITGGSYIDVDGFGGGNLDIRAGQLNIDNSTVSSFNVGSVKGGKISLQADQTTIQNGGEVFSSASGTGDAGDVSLRTGSLNVDGLQSPSLTGIFNFSNSSVAGSAGSVDVVATGAAVFRNGGEIATVTSGTGGNISFQADSLDLASPDFLTGLSTQSFSSLPGTSGNIDVTVAHDIAIANFGGIQTTASLAGNAGNITVNAGGAITLVDQGGISSTTHGSGSAGDISVTAGSLSLVNLSSILSVSSPSGSVLNTGNAGSIAVHVVGDILIQNGGLIGSETSSLGDAGSVTVTASSLTIDGNGDPNLFTGIADQAGPGSIGNAGDVTVDVTKGLTILNGGVIGSNTFSSGNGANVNVHAGSLLLDGMGSTGLTGISSNANTGSTGNGGSLTLNVDGAATITNAAQVTTGSFSSGNAGNLTMNVGGLLEITKGGAVAGGAFSSGSSGNMLVRAGSLRIDGTNNPNGKLTGISNQSNPGATGDAGPLTVDVAGAAVIANEGEIVVGTRSLGNGGALTVRAGSLTISSGPGTTHLTGISAETDGTRDGQGNPTGQGGNAGSVNVDVRGALTMLGGKITTDTFSAGNAGDVTVHAGTLSIDGSVNPAFLSGIFSNSDGYFGNVSGQGGNAGTVRVLVNGTLTIAGGGKIGAATLTSGRGGDVNVHGGAVNLGGIGSGITAQSLGTGNSGTVNVSGGSIGLAHGAVITSSSAHSNAGSVTVNAANNLTLADHSAVTTQAAINGGNVTLTAGGVVYLLDSRVTTAAGNNGGNILIGSQFVVLNNSLISANAALGQGGNITISSSFFLNQGSLITATGNTDDGTISITAPEFDLAGNLLVLPGDLIEANNELREQCARSLNKEFSSLIVVGRGGSEAAPEELQPDFGLGALGDAGTSVQ